MAPQIFPSLGPALIISMGYIDLGKWAAAIEGGASFGFSLLPLVIFLNCAAIFCQYLSSSIGVATEKNLAQIYSAEYSRSICIMLGIQAEISAIAMDISTVLGVAHGLCILSGMDIVPCILLGTIISIALPFAISHLDNVKAEVLYLGISGFALLFYVLGVLISQPEIPLSVNGLFPKLTGETSYSVMALLGSNVMVHNFYTHSASVQREKRSTNLGVEALCQDHFFAVMFVFSGIFLVNYVLVNAAASVVNHSGFSVNTLQDAFLLLDQVFRIPIPPIAFFLVLLFSSTVTSFSWEIGGLVVLRDLFHISFPSLSHQLLVRTLAAIFSLFCAQSSGAEGIYQLLVFCQVVPAIVLPSSVIPLFRVASSSPLMGSSKISWHLEIFALVTFFGILASNMLFWMELLFGSAGWVASLRGFSGFSLQFMVILLIAGFSLALTLSLAVTPLKSASHSQDLHMWALESCQGQVNEEEEDREEDMIREIDDVVSSTELVEPLFKSSLDVKFDLLDDQDSPPPESTQDESTEVKEEPLEMQPEIQLECHVAEEVKNLEGIPPKPATVLKAPPREKVNGVDSTKSTGLGRSARRTFAAVLDEFWGGLFDLHGKVTQEALAKRVDVLLGLEHKVVDVQPKAEIFPPIRNPRNYTPSPLSQTSGPTSWSSSSSTLQLLSSWNSGSQQNALEAAERRYSSLRLPQNNNTWDYQPATIHGNQISSYARGPNSSSRFSLNPSAPNYKGAFGYGPREEEEERTRYLTSSALQNLPGYYEAPLQSRTETNSSNKKYHSLPAISQWGGTIGNVGFDFGFDMSSSRQYGIGDPVGGTISNNKSLWARQPFEQFFEAREEATFSYTESETTMVRALKACIQKVMKLEGSEWLFKKEGGADEWIVEQIAAKERFLVEVGGGEAEVASVSNCGESCVWRMGLVVSFGVWCIVRVLELSQLESRPELWGKYTYVLNRLQGILELAFGRERNPPYACPCLNIPVAYWRATGSPPPANGARASRGMCTPAARVLDIVKDVELAISGRRGRTGTAAGDIAFPKGKENLASVLKRYKRRLSPKPPSVQELTPPPPRRIPLQTPPPGF